MEPKIRFNNNSWQKHKVRELCDLLTGYPFPGDKILNRGKNLLMRGINITEGRIRHSDEIDRYYNEDTIGLEKYRLQVGDLVIGMDGSKVGKNSALVTSKENYSLLVQRVARLRNEDKNLINLIQIAVGSDKFIKYVEEMKTSSAIPHISPADIRNFPLSLPEDSNERRLVASYFTSLDSQISAATSRLASLKQMKAASLQAMFPQEGETVPKIRFKGFEGEWKKVKLGDIAKFTKGQGYSKSDLKETGQPIILYGRMYTKYQFVIDEVDTFANLKDASILSEGDEIIMPASGETPEDIACASAVLAKDIILGGDLNIMHFDLTKISTPYIALVITYSKTHHDLSKCAQGKSVVHLHNGAISRATISLPSLAEQQAIASYFTSLDRKISLQSQRLEKLKQIKSACLDKMFV